MNIKIKQITASRKKELKEELVKRKNVLRKSIADKIDEAKQQGDLSENVAYTAAIEEYQLNELKISDLEKELRTVKVVTNKSGDNKVDIGDIVNIKNVDTEEESEYILGGEDEADPAKGKISCNSPMGQKLLGLTVGDSFQLELPMGSKEFKIIKVG